MSQSKNTTPSTPDEQKEGSIGGWAASPDQISKWKSDNPRGVKKFNVSYGGAIYHAYMRTPGMDDMTRATASERKRPGTFSKSLWENCKLGYHPEIEKNDTLLIGLFLMIDEVIEIADVTVEKI